MLKSTVHDSCNNDQYDHSSIINLNFHYSFFSKYNAVMSVVIQVGEYGPITLNERTDVEMYRVKQKKEDEKCCHNILTGICLFVLGCFCIYMIMLVILILIHHDDF